MKTPLFTLSEEVLAQIAELDDRQYYFRCVFTNETCVETIDALERQHAVKAALDVLNIDPSSDDVDVREDVDWLKNHVAPICAVRSNPAQPHWSKYEDGCMEYYVNPHLGVYIQVFRGGAKYLH